MVNVSTLFYVLENLEGKNDELIDFDEILEMERYCLQEVLGMIDGAGLEVSPSVVENILQKARCM